MIPPQIINIIKNENQVFSALHTLIEHILEPGFISVDLRDFLQNTKNATRIILLLKQTEITTKQPLIDTLKTLPKHHNLKSIWVDISLTTETQLKFMDYADTIEQFLSVNKSNKPEIIFIDSLSDTNQISILGFS
ncbi:MAG: hypothetical protein PF448_06475 [Bacteroidales bacterium]|jgi:hypothetical protein|nr:hypothetical protein [Bacteroidales bacterium]